MLNVPAYPALTRRVTFLPGICGNRCLYEYIKTSEVIPVKDQPKCNQASSNQDVQAPGLPNGSYRGQNQYYIGQQNNHTPSNQNVQASGLLNGPYGQQDNPLADLYNNNQCQTSYNSQLPTTPCPTYTDFVLQPSQSSYGRHWTLDINTPSLSSENSVTENTFETN
jgi:hypothetical protein